ncbi:hypothetical protein OAO92_07200 [Paracoccaceae bacterium]|nr:hypothetical protein [Paracoccaceae bacterium]MDC0583244.1 hypothetical protein [Paracoccaceae bacterium]
MFEHFRLLQGKNALRMFRPADRSDLARQKHEPVPKPVLNPERLSKRITLHIRNWSDVVFRLKRP